MKGKRSEYSEGCTYLDIIVIEIITSILDWTESELAHLESELAHLEKN